jgi:hypothetical protein
VDFVFAVQEFAAATDVPIEKSMQFSYLEMLDYHADDGVTDKRL